MVFDTGTCGSTSVWSAWTTNNISTGATGEAVTFRVWNLWTDAVTDNGTTGGTINSISSATNVWRFWAAGTGSSVQVSNGFSRYRERELTAEERAAEELQNTWTEAVLEDQARAREAAAKKAHELLTMHLDEVQKKDLADNKHFFVKSKSGRMYKVKHGKVHNVIMVHPATKEELLELCVTTEGHSALPEQDIMLAQKLWFEIHEDEALMKANIWDLRNNKRALSEEQKRQLAVA